MSRQSISFTRPNDEWLKAQVESEEYTSKSELVNDLVRRAREEHQRLMWLREKIDTAEKSGFTKQGAASMLAEFKRRAKKDGIL